MIGAADISGLLTDRIDQLVVTLLPAGHREGHEWRCGSVAGEPGGSLGVHLSGAKAGVWHDFAVGIGGDALDLVRAVLGYDMTAAIVWSRRWLGLDDGGVALPKRPASVKATEPEQLDPDRWRRPWRAAVPIAGTLAATYLAGRGLRFDDPAGRVLRFHPSRGRKGLDDKLEHHPAMLAALRDALTGQQIGIINIYLRLDGCGRLRDSKAKTVTGRAAGAAVMLSDFGEPTNGLVVCEGVETGIAILMKGLAPVWACGGAGALATLPTLRAIEALTIAADADEPGRKAAAACAARWRGAEHEVAIITPPTGDWADLQERAA